MGHSILAEDKRRVFRAAFDIAAGFNLDLEHTIDLARALTMTAFNVAFTGSVAAGASASEPVEIRKDEFDIETLEWE